MKVEQTILDHFVQKKHILVLQSVELAAGCDIKYLFQKIGAFSVFQYMWRELLLELSHFLLNISVAMKKIPPQECRYMIFYIKVGCVVYEHESQLQQTT